MADDNRGPRDGTLINIHEDGELRYWTQELDVGRDDLRKAVDQSASWRTTCGAISPDAAPKANTRSERKMLHGPHRRQPRRHYRVFAVVDDEPQREIEPIQLIGGPLNGAHDLRRPVGVGMPERIGIPIDGPESDLAWYDFDRETGAYYFTHVELRPS